MSSCTSIGLCFSIVRQPAEPALNGGALSGTAPPPVLHCCSSSEVHANMLPDAVRTHAAISIQTAVLLSVSGLSHALLHLLSLSIERALSPPCPNCPVFAALHPGSIDDSAVNVSSGLPVLIPATDPLQCHLCSTVLSVENNKTISNLDSRCTKRHSSSSSYCHDIMHHRVGDHRLCRTRIRRKRLEFRLPDPRMVSYQSL